MFKDILKTPDALKNAILGQDDLRAKSNQGLQAVRSGVDSLKTVLANHQQAKDALQQQQQATSPSSFSTRHGNTQQAIGLDGRPTTGQARGTNPPFTSSSRSGSAMFTRSLSLAGMTESLKTIGTGLGLQGLTAPNTGGRKEEHGGASSGGWDAERSVPRDRDTRRSMDSSTSGALSFLARIQHHASSPSSSSSPSSAFNTSHHHQPSSSSTGSGSKLEGGGTTGATGMMMTTTTKHSSAPIGWASTEGTITAAKTTAQRLAKVRAKDTTSFNVQRMPHVEQLAQRYHNSWMEIHDHTAKNAAKAEQADALLEQVLAACERHVQASTQLWNEAKGLDSLDSTMQNMMTITENIHKKLAGLEEAIEKLESDAEVAQFANWKKERVDELDRYMDDKRKEMWDKAELLAARSQEYQREESQRRLKLIEEQFANDMDEFRRRKMAEEAKVFGPVGLDDDGSYDNGSVNDYGDNHAVHSTGKRSSTSSLGIPGLITSKELAATTKEIAATTKGFFERLSSTLSTTSLGHIPTSNSASSRSSVTDVVSTGGTTSVVGTLPPLPMNPQTARRGGASSSSSQAVRDSVLFVDNVQPERADQEALDQFLGSDSSLSDDEVDNPVGIGGQSAQLGVTFISNIGGDYGETSSEGKSVELVPEEDIEDGNEPSEEDGDEEDKNEEDEDSDEEEEMSSDEEDSDDDMDPIARARLARLGMRHGHKSGSTIAVFSLANASRINLPS